MTFAEKVRYCRESMEFSQRELAHELGLSARSIAAYEAGTIPHKDNLFNLAQVLCVPATFLLDDSIEDPPEEFYDDCYRHLLDKYRKAAS